MIALTHTRSDSEKILDIGCGEGKIDCAIGLDTRNVEAVDVVGDGRQLPFEDDVFDRVYASHVIEHFSHRSTKEVLSEWTRVITQGGVLEIRCPYLRVRAAIYALTGKTDYIKYIYGGQDHEFNYHKQGFGFGSLKDSLLKIGCTNITIILDGYRGIPFLPRDLHIEAVVE